MMCLLMGAVPGLLLWLPLPPSPSLRLLDNVGFVVTVHVRRRRRRRRHIASSQAAQQLRWTPQAVARQRRHDLSGRRRPVLERQRGVAGVVGVVLVAILDGRADRLLQRVRRQPFSVSSSAR